MTEHPTSTPAPPSTRDLDADLRKQVTKWMRLRWWLTAAVGALLVVGLVIGGFLINQQQNELSASCGLYHDIGQLDVKPTPPLKKVGQISVVIVLDARRAFIGQCHGPIKPVTGSVAYWAGYYHLQVPAPYGRPPR